MSPDAGMIMVLEMRLKINNLFRRLFAGSWKATPRLFAERLNYVIDRPFCYSRFSIQIFALLPLQLQINAFDVPVVKSFETQVVFLFFYGDVVHKISASYLLSSRVTLLIFSPTGSSFNHHFPFDANGATGRNARRKDTQARRRPFTDEFQPNPEKLVRYFQSTNEEIYSIKKTI